MIVPCHNFWKNPNNQRKNQMEITGWRQLLEQLTHIVSLENRKTPISPKKESIPRGFAALEILSANPI